MKGVKKMKKRIALLLVIVMLLCLTACGKPAPAVEEEKAGPLPTDRTYSVLFIGNSYTYYNSMPDKLFFRFAKLAGYKVEVTSITKGAYLLEQFADPADSLGANVEMALTGEKKYDFVVLQEQSVLPAKEDAEQFYRAVRNLAERIRQAGAEPVLYSTWGRKTGNSALKSNGWTNETMTWRLAAAYSAIGEEQNIPVAHAGLAFFDVYTGDSGIELYHTDSTHPSAAGSYLAAATLFAKIFGVDPTTVAFDSTLSAEDAAVLRQAAKTAVFETPAIPEEYRITLTAQ